MALFNSPTITPQDSFTASPTQTQALGTLATTADGRRFRYAQIGVADAIAGQLYQGAAPLALHLANTPPAVAIGATAFTYTPGAIGAAANLYAEGYLGVDTAPGAGYTYQVSGHGAITASVPFTLRLRDPIQVALTNVSRVGLMPNGWKNVVVTPATITARVAGVAPAALPANQYGWLQTYGPAAVLITGAVVITGPVMTSSTVPGSVEPVTGGGLATANLIGHAMQAGVAGKYNFVFLQMD